MTTEALAPTAAEPAVRSGRCVQRCSELALVGSIPNMDATDERCIKRLMQRFYEQPLINNVHRGDYVECMIALALEPAWRLTKPWTSWDLVHEKTGARIEVKQSAALAPWAPERPARGRFDIRLRTGYYSEDGAWTKTPQRKRHACLYVFAWHPGEDADADHRRPDQWEFFVVAETCLPPEQDSISLGPLVQVVERCDLAERCGYDALETKVDQVLTKRRRLDKFTQPGWAIEVVGTWDEETQTIKPLTKADRDRLRPKK